MAKHDIALSPVEWAEVAKALEEAETAPRPSTGRGLLSRLSAMVRGTKPAAPDDCRRMALGRFVFEAADRRHSVDELAPPLALLGFNRRQIEALARLSAPGRAWN